MHAFLLTIGGLAFFLYLVVPVLVLRKMWFDAEPVFETVDHDDPRLPEKARAFFGDVAADIEALGFTPTAFVINREVAPNTTGYIALFDNHAAMDAAAAMFIVSVTGTAAPPILNYNVDFATDFADGGELVTGNASAPGGLPTRRSKQVHRVPRMADLATLYRLHQSLVLQRGGLAKKPLPPKNQAVAAFREAVVSELRWHAECGRLRLDPAKARYHFTWRGGYMAVWGQLPPILQVCRWLLRRRARALLRQFDLASDYATVDFRQRYEGYSLDT